MLKRLFALLLLSTSSIFACGLYVGGDIGFAILQTRETTSVPSEQHKLGGIGFIGGGLVGYNFVFSNYDLGIEGFINGNTTKNLVYHNATASRFAVSSRYNWGFRALPGYFFNDYMEGHLILGWSRGHFSISDNGVWGFISGNFDVDGFQFGGGTTFPLFCNFTIRFDSTFVYYPQRKLTGIATTLVSDLYSLRVHAFDTTATLIYNF